MEQLQKVKSWFQSLGRRGKSLVVLVAALVVIVVVELIR
jgi:flagellar biosynthesis/type III secretory pathway M-ring protein FliF/YscJ